MGATIGINTMLLLASVFYIIKKEKPEAFEKRKPWVGRGIVITNIALFIFWASLLGSGLVKISSKLHNDSFYTMMQKCEPYFKVFAYSGTVILLGLFILIYSALKILSGKKEIEKATARYAN
jgi:nitric oxide reductase subunit B